MRKLDNYIIKTVGGATLLVMLVVLSLDFIFGFIGELDDTANDYQALDALLYVVMTMPRRIYDYRPGNIGQLIRARGHSCRGCIDSPYCLECDEAHYCGCFAGPVSR